MITLFFEILLLGFLELILFYLLILVNPAKLTDTGRYLISLNPLNFLFFPHPLMLADSAMADFLFNRSDRLFVQLLIWDEIWCFRAIHCVCMVTGWVWTGLLDCAPEDVLWLVWLKNRIILFCNRCNIVTAFDRFIWNNSKYILDPQSYSWLMLDWMSAVVLIMAEPHFNCSL